MLVKKYEARLPHGKSLRPMKSRSELNESGFNSGQLGEERATILEFDFWFAIPRESHDPHRSHECVSQTSTDCPQLND